jgi:glycosyltransferase involved in cell wall biosynthesis
MDSLTIFYPAFNEEAYIRRAVEAAQEVGEAMVSEKAITFYEIIIVNDASTDNTARIADKMAQKHANIRVVHHGANRGLGGAVRSGLANASGSVILYSDIDLPFDMMETRKAFRLMRYYEADIVTAFRFDRISEGFRRMIYSKVYNTLIHIVFGLRIKDVNFSCKLIRKEVLEAFELKSEGSFIDAELLVKANRSGYNIIQFGTNYFHRSRGVSTLSSWRVIFKILRELATLFREIRSVQAAAK